MYVSGSYLQDLNLVFHFALKMGDCGAFIQILQDRVCWL
uniref:Uncharacterized protein n=1 Tax=Kalanchoe fedtschenkoi TaxID=63787 RepID=A0A7N0UEY8_KALFE